jgi:predicted MFS family arabinose efflux permease
MWAAGVVVTLHVVSHLDRSYAEAGIVDMVLALALGVSGPWRGRRLDRVGLRATVAPSLVVLAVCWSIAPWVGYWPLVALVAVAGVFTVPSFSIVRQVLIGAVPDQQRTAVLSVDSVVVECSFMIGPVLGVLAATYLPTPVALFLCQMLAIVGALALFVSNPSLGQEPSGDGTHHSVRTWLTPGVVAILVVSATATLVLTGEDLGTVAAMRQMHHTTSIGWVLALWGLGSAIGGVVYGALRKHPPAPVLLVLLAASTTLVAVTDDRLLFTVLLFVSGVFCAPTITATVDDLSRAVPASVRGEAMGWHGSALTFGGAVGAPLVGSAIDAGRWPAGFWVAGLVGLASAVVGLAVRMTRASGRVPAANGPDVESDVDAEPAEDLARRLAAVERVEVQAGGAAGE